MHIKPMTSSGLQAIPPQSVMGFKQKFRFMDESFRRTAGCVV